MTPMLPYPRLKPRVFASLLIVAFPLLVLGGLVVLGVGRSQMREVHGNNLAQMANRTAAAVDSYVFRRILDVALLGKVPTLREAATGATAAFDLAAARALDREWQDRHAPPDALASLLNSPASRFLSEVVRDDTIYREILLTDRHGRLVAASGIASDYFQGDESWWTEAFGDGINGRVRVGDVAWDESGATMALDIAVPIRSAQANAVAGVLKVVTDSREMFTVLAGIQPGLTGEAALVREDGSIVFRRGPLEKPTEFFAANLLRERLDALKTGDPQIALSFSAKAIGSDERYVVGVAPSQLGASYPNLHWLIAVSQAESELFAPMRQQAFLLFMLLLTVAVAVLALALWFSMRLAEPTSETDMHLVEHAPIPHLEEQDESITPAGTR